MSLALAAKLRDLEQRVASLEARCAGAGQRRIAGLAGKAEARRQDGARLRDETRSVLATHQGARPLKALAVQSYLRRTLVAAGLSDVDGCGSAMQITVFAEGGQQRKLPISKPTD